MCPFLFNQNSLLKYLLFNPMRVLAKPFIDPSPSANGAMLKVNGIARLIIGVLYLYQFRGKCL